jgi:glycosyltransferase involved in cell wall biosynthesis
VSPYHTGSHLSWSQGYIQHSQFHISLLSLAGRFWKWRMQGGAIPLAAQAQTLLAEQGPPQAILATDMLNLPAWLGLLRGRLPASVPVILYMHENQLSYPLRPGESPDLTYGMINWLSQLAADRLFFNSQFHLESWFDALPRLLKHLPDYNHLEQIRAVRAKSGVLPVGIHLGQEERPAGQGEEPPLILWNQRWEYDKRPDRFFNLLYRLKEEGIPFRLAVAGENFRQQPQEFEEARQRLQDETIQWGFLPSRGEYEALLARSDLVISTADHEFFGISILEAVAAGAFPLLPNRLSYPELIPPELHPAVLYADEADLLAKAAQRLRQPRSAPPSLQGHVRERFTWSRVAQAYDAVVREVAGEIQKMGRG